MNANRQTAVGAFVLGGLVLGLAAIVMFGKFNLFNPSIRAAVIFQNSIAGLSVGAPVTFRGVRVGAVDGIGIQYDTKTRIAYIPVTVTIDPGHAILGKRGGDTIDLPDLVAHGLRAELNVQSFVTGQSEIDLDFDPTSPPILHEDVTKLPEIPTRQSTFQRATEQLSQLPLRQLADDTTATLRSLRGVTEKLNTNLPPVIDSLKTTLDKSGQTVDTVNQAIKTLQSRLDTTLAAITQVADTGSQQLTQRGAELHTLLMTTNQSITQMHGLLGDLKSITSDRAADRANVDATLRDLAAAAASLRGFANDVEHNPQLLLTGRKP
ncbi:MlaD family protein [Acidisphaera sp. S103]|uniref:MlaD family protein n=1 Tax=Acidisphaera sp. S103 TaxID=1747223 RepID=UPI00131EB687|nr:MlaD family protein [Acidisphaera sp. S103]